MKRNQKMAEIELMLASILYKNFQRNNESRTFGRGFFILVTLKKKEK